MSFFAVLFALIIEQLRPMPRHNIVHRAMVGWSAWAGRNFDAGQSQHAWVVWSITVLAPALLALAVHLVLTQFSLLLALAWDVAVLYLTLGFRHFSHFFTEIREALERGDEGEARRLLADWRNVDTSELPRTELLRHLIEHSLLAAHRHVFGVFFCFVVVSALGGGPAGAVLYRLAEFAGRYWSYRSRTLGVPVNAHLMECSQAAYEWIDRGPARLTAFGFAVMGNFEESVDCWRRDAPLWRRANEGVILAAAAGAVGVSLGGDSPPPMATDRPRGLSAGGNWGDAEARGSTPGMAPEIGHLRSVVGLVWRSVVLWMLLLALLTLANLVG